MDSSNNQHALHRTLAGEEPVPASGVSPVPPAGRPRLNTVIREQTGQEAEQFDAAVNLFLTEFAREYLRSQEEYGARLPP